MVSLPADRQKSFTVDGKRYRLSPRIPIGEIKSWVARFHVGATDATIKSLMAAKLRDAPAEWTDALKRQAKAYAIYCHRKNQALFNYVYRITPDSSMRVRCHAIK